MPEYQIPRSSTVLQILTFLPLPFLRALVHVGHTLKAQLVTDASPYTGT